MVREARSSWSVVEDATEVSAVAEHLADAPPTPYRLTFLSTITNAVVFDRWEAMQSLIRDIRPLDGPERRLG